MHSPTERKEKIRAVFKSLLDGEYLSSALRQTGISKSLFYTVLREYPELEQEYEETQRIRAEAYIEDSFQLSESHGDPVQVKNMLDIRKWYASRILRGKFGDKLDVSVNQTVDIRSAISEAQARVRIVSPADWDGMEGKILMPDRHLLKQNNTPDTRARSLDCNPFIDVKDVKDVKNEYTESDDALDSIDIPGSWATDCQSVADNEPPKSETGRSALDELLS